jgi:DNA polymerase elongation subunit (family B)
MKIDAGMLDDLLMSYSLDYISKVIGIVTDADAKIKTFDYSILNKPLWTAEEQATIREYTLRDIEVTKKMYEWLENYFDSFKSFLNPDDVETKKYLTCSTGVFAYKAICKELGVREEYNDDPDSLDSYGGGYVAYPAGETFEDHIYCLDFNSLYPSIFHQCNLFSQVDIGWSGDSLFKTIGTYNDKEQGKIEKLIIKFYEMRLAMKKAKDPREYSVKIIINTMYGLTGNPSFKLLYRKTTAADCTYIARQWIKYARKQFKLAGYKVIYTDTDSVYLIDVFKDKERLLKVKNEIVEEIKRHVPFPYAKFDMGIDAEITHMWFFINLKATKIQKTIQ